jgi:hypothetical protein
VPEPLPTEDAPRLVASKPPDLRGTVFPVTGDYAVVGRQRGCDVHLDDATVSRNHASLHRSGGRTVVTDLGSSNGTAVNGRDLGETPRALRPGDVVRFGDVEARFEVSEGGPADVPPTALRSAPAPVEYTVGSQAAGQLNNVGHDQYNAYVQQVREERDSFARDIASTRTKARRLVWVGFAMCVLGGGTYMWGILRFAGQVDRISPGAQDTFQPHLFGPEVGGIPVGLIGFAVAAVGSVLLVVGVVLHVVAASRRRQLQTAPPPSPWQFAPPPQAW